MSVTVSIRYCPICGEATGKATCAGGREGHVPVPTLTRPLGYWRKRP